MSETAPIALTFPNTITSTSDVPCTMCISMRGGVEDGIGVTVTRPSGGLLADTYSNYTTTAAYFYVSFNTNVFDQPLAIKNGMRMTLELGFK